MKGLILKDIINMKGQLMLYMIIFAMWMAVGIVNKSAEFFIGVMQMLIVMIPILSLAYDEKTKWERFAITMPVTRRQLVISKYLFCLIVIAVIMIPAAAGGLIIGGDPETILVMIALSVPLGLILNSVILPVMFRFGVEKGRFMFMAIIALFALAGFAVSKLPAVARLMDTAIPTFAADGVIFIAVIFWLAGLGLAAVSMAISCKIYGGKEF